METQKRMTTETAYRDPKMMETEKEMIVEAVYKAPKKLSPKRYDYRSNISLFYICSTDYVSNFYYYSCCMGFLSLSEAKLGVLWKSLGHAEKFLFSKLYRCFPKSKHGYLYVEFSHGNRVGSAHFIDCGLTSSLCIGKVYL